MVQFRYQSKGSTFSCYHPFIWNARPQWTFQQIWSINHLNAHHHGHFTLHQSQSVLFSPHPNLCRADSSATVRRRLQTRRDYPLHHFQCITHYITLYYISTTHYITSRASPITLHYITLHCSCPLHHFPCITLRNVFNLWLSSCS